MVMSKRSTIIFMLALAALMVQIGCGGNNKSQRQTINRSLSKPTDPNKTTGGAGAESKLTTITNADAALTPNAKDNKEVDGISAMPAGKYKLTSVTTSFHYLSNSGSPDVRVLQINQFEGSEISSSTPQYSEDVLDAADAGVKINLPSAFTIKDGKIQDGATNLTFSTQVTSDKGTQKVTDTTSAADESLKLVLAKALANGEKTAGDGASIKIYKLSETSVRIVISYDLKTDDSSGGRNIALEYTVAADAAVTDPAVDTGATPDAPPTADQQ